ncbi:MAG: 16S rRNA (cytosine(1402)-N(4))-methyltransferase RsmH [Bacteroidales bacterium]|nr:16S rRNA (cytosine(1402)-N(4))-methyltransferase RsmH [Bacteroidales bacterium]MDY5193403.1 16S rRNA (cytosine(1402)-N(4))-methyltransferase RsmH [Candidatus Aphodosoma sp.]
MNEYHVPVLLKESIEALDINPDGIYVDVTFGGGGHSREILRHLSERGHLYSFDQDADAMKNAFDDDRFTFVRSNFVYLKNFLKYYGVEKIDGLIADLGVSSHHFDDEERGFSFRFNAPLDMRMNKSLSVTAADIVNNYAEAQLSLIFYLYGELSNAKKIAHTIVLKRAETPILDTNQLLDTVKPFFMREREKKDVAKLFQALRIEVNNEMMVLRKMLSQTADVMSENGKLVVITYHSLEDRIVKNFIKTGNCEGEVCKDFYGNIISPFKALNNKVITPSDEELTVNPRSRSAKMRVAVKL